MTKLKGLFNPKSSSGSHNVKEVVDTYKASGYRRILALIIFIFLLIIAFGVALGIGPYQISIGRVYDCIFYRFTHWDEGIQTLDMRIIWEQRMPIILTAVIAGIGLGGAGAAMQSMMKNPLADPYTTGISSGAAFGADIAILLGITIGGYGIVANAFIFALIPAAIIIVLSTVKRTSPATMILAGLSIMYIFNAISTYLMLISDEQTMAQAYEWSIGTLSRSSWDTLAIMTAVVFMGGMLLMYLTKYLNSLNCGDEYAKTLGINVNRIRVILLIAISIVAASIVSFTGIIGFVGLVGPHIARIFIGSNNRFLMPASMLTGSAILVVAHIVSMLFAEQALPIGLVTSMIGGPVFLFIIMRQKKEVW